MTDIIRPDFSNKGPDFVYKVEELIDYKQLLTDLLKKREELIVSEEEKPEWAQDSGKLDRLEDEIDRINEWLTNLSTKSDESVKDFIKLIESESV